MKTQFVTLLISLASLFSSFATAGILSPANEKNSKLIKMVNKADKNDWRTLNKAARLSINWNADLELAKQWLEASIFITENSEAYEILGDYYLRKGDMQKAYDHYFKAFETGMFTLDKKDKDRIQRKVLCFGRSLLD
ncbi:hypothetical protein [Flammeovirga aprica]|uniref:Tetratricopeptide repeat protein n=1 Tax=Flammeovirga aprica JL-4 TaxID=694437 RepID=A0A7X9RYY1_9BACT|nr:hypothetical protein [Flammeovirga aprica]NME71184.1 hypothetical protein [Flammeovirga aprica JL-4]